MGVPVKHPFTPMALNLSAPPARAWNLELLQARGVPPFLRDQDER